MNKAKELSEAHWKYIEEVLYSTDKYTPSMLDIIGFHYKTAMIHGYGHGWEDAKNEQ